MRTPLVRHSLVPTPVANDALIATYVANAQIAAMGRLRGCALRTVVRARRRAMLRCGMSAFVLLCRHERFVEAAVQAQSLAAERVVHAQREMLRPPAPPAVAAVDRAVSVRADDQLLDMLALHRWIIDVRAQRLRRHRECGRIFRRWHTHALKMHRARHRLRRLVSARGRHELASGWNQLAMHSIVAERGAATAAVALGDAAALRTRLVARGLLVPGHRITNLPSRPPRRDVSPLQRRPTHDDARWRLSTKEQHAAPFSARTLLYDDTPPSADALQRARRVEAWRKKERRQA